MRAWVSGEKHTIPSEIVKDRASFVVNFQDYGLIRLPF